MIKQAIAALALCLAATAGAQMAPADPALYLSLIHI